jgi:hypothetical protein
MSELTLWCWKSTVVKIGSDAEKTEFPIKLMAKSTRSSGLWVTITFWILCRVCWALNLGSKGLVHSVITSTQEVNAPGGGACCCWKYLANI